MPEGELKPDVADNVTDISPLTLAPIELEPIAVQRLTAEQSIHIDQLPPIAPIAVPPLGVDDQGDRR
jgi:hypothetical protein